jgi:hypothetical protein
MIKADGSNGHVQLNGVAITLMAEYAMLTKSLISILLQRSVAVTWRSR